MKAMFATATLAASVALSAPITQAQSQQDIMFDSEGYLAACSSRVPKGAMQVPMLRLCVSSAIKLCNLSLEMQRLGACIARVSLWLEQDSQHIKQRYPGAQRIAERSSAFTGLFPQGGPQNDCSDSQIAGLTSAQICAYQEALLNWIKLSVVEFDQTTRTR